MPAYSRTLIASALSSALSVGQVGEDVRAAGGVFTRHTPPSPAPAVFRRAAREPGHGHLIDPLTAASHEIGHRDPARTRPGRAVAGAVRQSDPRPETIVA